MSVPDQHDTRRPCQSVRPRADGRRSPST